MGGRCAWETGAKIRQAVVKRIAVLQSNYIPWKGYFDLVASVDAFVLYDTVQFTKNDWRNRNRIKTPNGVKWLTLPVTQGMDQRICDVRITDTRWKAKHWKTLVANYAKAPFFRRYAPSLAHTYEQCPDDTLSQVNAHFIKAICSLLEIKTPIFDVREMDVRGGRMERLVDICCQLQATQYVTGPAARSYLNEDAFAAKNIGVEWFHYPDYPPYEQLWGPFEHGVTIIDTLFHCGAQETRAMLGCSRN